MPHTNPPPGRLYNILNDAQTIAIVGASSNPARASHGVMKMLQRSGYKCIPVNPNEESVLGEKSYANLSDIETDVDIVNVFRRSELTPPVAEDAVKIGAKTLWLQLGVANDEAAATAADAGLEVVMDSCIAVVLGQLDVPPRAGLSPA